jgi:probable DNA metabolism protein
MKTVRLASETDFAGWRAGARDMRTRHIPPEVVVWTTKPELFSRSSPSGGSTGEAGDGGSRALTGGLEPPQSLRDSSPKGGAPEQFSVPRDFIELAEAVICHRSADRFALLYRLLWRMRKEPNLLHIATDPDVAKVNSMRKQVDLAVHKMHAFVRFRLLEGVEPETYVAWFEPAHRVVERAAPHFLERFTGMRFSILTPDGCLHWDGEQANFTPGVDASQAPAADALDDMWRTYYASIFNPARLKVRAMTKEMPKKYWRNLPEARLIPELIASAEDRTQQMVAQPPVTPSKRVFKAAQRIARDGRYDEFPPSTMEEVVAGVDLCRRCDLWRCGTQGVPGEGPVTAKLMLVGEQPGDQEDLAGRPFVGPAGAVLDKALAEAGVDRDRAFVTNAVKHFKHEPRGKRRIHKTPNGGEVKACRWWLDAERRIVRPRVIVALGSMAALSVIGKPTPIGANRGKAIQLPDQSQGVVTYHPSFLLRVPDAETKARAYAEFVEDLKFAAELAG